MNIRETVLEVLYAVVPIIAFVSLLQLTVVRLPTDVSVKFLAGSVMVILGLAFFLLGVKAGFLPIGELIGSTIVSKGKLWLLLSTGFVLGFVVTVADPVSKSWPRRYTTFPRGRWASPSSSSQLHSV